MPNGSNAQRVVEDLKVEIFRSGMSQQRVAEIAGFSPAAVQRRLAGDVAPTLEEIERIADAAGVDVLVDLRRRPQSTPSPAQSVPGGLPPAGEGVPSRSGAIRAALTDIATRFPVLPAKLAVAMDEHGGDAVAFAWIDQSGRLLRLEMVDPLAATG